MEMNVSNQDLEHEVAPKKKGGINPVIIIPILLALGIAIYIFVFGNPANFQPISSLEGKATVVGSGVPSKNLNPTGMVGIIYMGGVIVPILLTFLMTVIVFSLERAFALKKASGKGDLDAFVRTIRSLISRNKIDEAIEACDDQKGTVGNVIREGLVTYKALQHDDRMDKEQKMAALNKSLEEATTLEMPMLERNMMILSTLGTVSTLVALLGTVIGMIKAFHELGAGGGSPDAGALSVGISEALVNTALGIGTAALAIILYNYFTSKIDNLTFKIDEIGMSLQQSFAEYNR